jgi:hypothetical protein
MQECFECHRLVTCSYYALVLELQQTLHSLLVSSMVLYCLFCNDVQCLKLARVTVAADELCSE